MIQNLREMLLAKREIVDAEVTEMTSLIEMINITLRGNQPRNLGTLMAKTDTII